MRNTLELDLSLCDYAFTNLSVGYRKRRSSLREFICEKGGAGGEALRNKLPKSNVFTLPLIPTDIPLDCWFGLQTAKKKRKKEKGFALSPIFMIGDEIELSYGN